MNSSTHPTSLAASVEVIFEDDEIIVFKKPSGLLVLPDRYNSSIPNLCGFLKNKDGQKSVVHRIDKETSVREADSESNRTILHAARLLPVDPATGQRGSFEVECPQDMRIV